MELKKQKFKCKCDLNNCKNDADYYITGEGVLPSRRLNICDNCAKELSKLIRNLPNGKEVRVK